MTNETPDGANMTAAETAAWVRWYETGQLGMKLMLPLREYLAHLRAAVARGARGRRLRACPSLPRRGRRGGATRQSGRTVARSRQRRPLWPRVGPVAGITGG